MNYEGEGRLKIGNLSDEHKLRQLELAVGLRTLRVGLIAPRSSTTYSSR